MTRRCRDCGRENPDDSFYCNWCGKPISSPVADSKTCPHCGATNPMHAPFCQSCAKDFPQQVAIAQQPPAGILCVWCGASVNPAEARCPSCGRDPSGRVQHSPPKSQGPTMAAIIFVGAAVLDFISAAMLFTAEGYSMELGIDLTGMLEACGVLCLIFGFMALVAAVLSYLRAQMGIAILAGALAMIGLGPYALGSVLALIGLVLVVRDRNEFMS